VRVCDDAGHGGSDSGAVARNRVKESDRNLAISGKLAIALRERGQQVVLTRTNNTSPSPLRRAKFANEHQCDVFVSIHGNDQGESGNGEVARGIEIWHHDKSARGKALAQAVLGGVHAGVPYLPSRGLKRAGTDAPWAKGRRPSVISDTKMPAIIIECGFMSSAEDVELLGRDGVQRVLAEGIAEGIGEWGRMERTAAGLGRDSSEDLGMTGPARKATEAARMPVVGCAEIRHSGASCGRKAKLNDFERGSCHSGGRRRGMSLVLGPWSAGGAKKGTVPRSACVGLSAVQSPFSAEGR